MIEKSLIICENYQVYGEFCCNYEIMDQIACIQNYRAFAHCAILNSFLILVD
jgi:hypothetical protein